MRDIPLSADRFTTHELPHATAREEIGIHAVMLTTGQIPGFTIDHAIFDEHTTPEGFAAIAEHFPDHELAGGEILIGTPSGKDIEIPHTDREETFPSGNRDSFRLHRTEPYSHAGADITLGLVDGVTELDPGTTFTRSSSPDAHEIAYYNGHADRGHYTVFDANGYHQFVNDVELGVDDHGQPLVRSSTITDLARKNASQQ